MQLPNKLFTYGESILSKFSPVLKTLENEGVPAGILYTKLKHHFEDINEFIEVLDALYALNKIDYDEEKEVLIYVV
ncbi:MAG: hypothetical protein JXN10_02570 [Clostridia bacterium]|nr:hypothetical protein [Clostridia bacterium]